MSASTQPKTRDAGDLNGNDGEHYETGVDTKSVRKMSDKNPKSKTIGKGDARYWTQRGKLLKDKRSPFYFCKIQVGRRRESFPLRLTNKEVAATKAAQIYNDIVVRGWDAAIEKHKPETARAIGCPTIGRYLSELQAMVSFRGTTLRAYVQALRAIAAGIAGIGDQVALDENEQPRRDRRGRVIYLSRRDHQKGGAEAWRTKVDGLRLSVLQDDAVQKWKLAYLSEHGTNPLQMQRAKHTLNSMLRSARSLFSDRKGRLKHVRAKLDLPEPLPFAGVSLEDEGSKKYVSKVDARQLIAAAKRDLASDPQRLEQFKVFCLGLLAGLRKREIDTLTWEQVQFDLGAIHICRTEFFNPKSKESEANVDCDPELLALLRGWRAKARGAFVIESKRKARYHKAPASYYRCEQHFTALYAWLAKQGIKDQKPLHTLRKELGSILANEQGIFAAQQVLRHAHIQTTAKHYADKRVRMTAGLGALLADASATAKVIEFSSPGKKGTAKPERQKERA